MARTDANPPMPEFRDDYVLQEVDADYLAKAVKPKQFIHIDQSECIMCEGCVDICPWKCIHMVVPEAIDEAVNTEQPGIDPSDHVIYFGLLIYIWHWWQHRGDKPAAGTEIETSSYGRPLVKKG